MSVRRIMRGHVPSPPVRSAFERSKSRFKWVGGVLAVLACGTWVQERSLMDSAPVPGEVSILEAPVPMDELDWLGEHFSPEVLLTFTGASSVVAPVGDVNQPRAYAPVPSEDWTLSAVLPADGVDPVVFHGTPGTALKVRNATATGPARSVGKSVAYETEHGASYWVQDGSRVEEWVRVDRPMDGEVARYTVEGGTFLATEQGVTLLNGDGVAALDVSAPVAWSADGQVVDVWLEVHEDELALMIDSPVDSVGPLMVDPVWTLADDLGEGRRNHTANRLLDGRVLIAGGVDESGAITDEVELFSPASQSWSNVAAMPFPMRSHGSVTLEDGRVMVQNGRSDGFTSNGQQAWIYDSNSDAWTVADPARSLIGGTGAVLGLRPVLLANGQVMMSGNFGVASGRVTHVYDPSTDTFHRVADMNEHRLNHSMTLLDDGSVLAAGGGNSSYKALISNTAELFVPDWSSSEPYLNGSWTPVGLMSAGHYDHEAELLQDGPNSGKVLVCGGLDGSTVPGSYLYTQVCDLYDPVSQTFSAADSLPNARARSFSSNAGGYMATLVAGMAEGSIVAAGGYPSTTSVDVFDPFTMQWSGECDLNNGRFRHRIVALDDGSVAVFGGQPDWDSGPIRSVERLSLEMDDSDCDGLGDPMDICPFGGCGQVRGRVFYDEYDDCSDVGDTGARARMIRADNGTIIRYAFTNDNGDYALDLPDGDWDISLVGVNASDFSNCSQGEVQYSVDAASGREDLDFPLKGACDFALVVTGSGTTGTPCNGLPYPGACADEPFEVCVEVNNTASAWNTATLGLELPVGATGISVSTSADCAGILDTPTIDATAIPPSVLVTGSGGGGSGYTGDNTNGGSGACELCETFTPVTEGLSVSTSMSASNSATGSPACVDNSTASFNLGPCSCDPNDKLVSPEGCDESGTVSETPLDYRVRFENVGDGPAWDVYVVDALDPDLDLESLTIHGASHDITDFQIDESGRMFVAFEDIFLPPAAEDGAAARGFIHFGLDMATTVDGTSFTNDAEIYFDQNAAVVTNRVENTLGVCPDDGPPGLSGDGPSASGLGDGSNPGQGSGSGNSPNQGSGNPNNAP